MGYIWKKRGVIKIAGETVEPRIGQDVTDLLEEVDPDVVKNLLDDRRIEDDSEAKKEEAELLAKERAQLAEVKKKVAEKKKKAGK